MKLSTVQFVLVFGLASLMAATADDDDDDLAKQIRDANAEFTRLWAEGDFEGVSQLYTEDAVLLPPGAPVFKGRAELSSAFQRVSSVKGVNKVVFEETYISPEFEGTAYSYGISREYDANEAEIGRGHVLIIWDVTEDGPLRRVDIFNH